MSDNNTSFNTLETFRMITSKCTTCVDLCIYRSEKTSRSKSSPHECTLKCTCRHCAPGCTCSKCRYYAIEKDY